MNVTCSNPGKKHFYISLIIFLLAASFWFVQTKGRAGSWSDSSRMAAIESWIEQGTWQIDESDFAGTGDKVFLNGHFYSDKPPLLQFLASQIYGVMYHYLGADLADQDCVSGEICAYKWLTFLTIGLPSALMLASFYWFSSKITGTVWRSLLPTGLLMLGTLVWPYSLVFSNHIPAAASLFLGFQLLSGESEKKRQFFFGGLLAALAASFDFTASFIAIPFAAWVVFGRRRYFFFFTAGALIPIVLTAILNYQVTGSILPAYLQPDAYSYSGSKMAIGVAGNAPPTKLLRYAFDSLAGYRGVLSHSPVLLWGIAGLILTIYRKKQTLWQPGIFLLAGILLQVLYILTQTSNFGGWSYGARWFSVWIPTLMFYMPFALPTRWSWSGILNGFLLALACLLSVLSAAQGAFQPWISSRPVVYPTLKFESPFVEIKAYFERDLLTSPEAWARWVICPRWDVGNLSELPVFTGDVGTLSSNFDGKVILMGYELPAETVKAGEPYPLVLYWQPLGMLWENYVQFVQIQDSQHQIYGEIERKLETGESECWRPGEIIVDRYEIPVLDTAQDGEHFLSVRLREEGDNMPFLPLIQEKQHTETTSVIIGPISTE